MTSNGSAPLNAFCVDLEEWFHICGMNTPYSDPATWDRAPAIVERNTDVLLRLLSAAKTRATFITLGWIAEKYPRLVRRVAEQGHEVGCHGYYHRLVFEQTPDEFRAEIRRAKRVIEDASGHPAVCYRAPGFSMKRECFWAYPILVEEGFTCDISVVPAPRAHGGVSGFEQDAFLLRTPAGEVSVFPVSIMRVGGRAVPFSGGGYLRMFPLALVRRGFAQNHREGRPVMTYIHPREIDPGQPRLELPALRGFKYYVGVAGCEAKLRRLLVDYRFASVAEVLRAHPPRQSREYRDGEIVAVATS